VRTAPCVLLVARVAGAHGLSAFSAALLPRCVPSIVRYVGMMTIIMNDYPWVKFALIGGMGLFVLTSREGA
jgi:hypothetical protein